MTQAVAALLHKVEQLSPPERIELADRLVETIARDIPPDVERAQIDEVRRRIAQLDGGEVALVPGDEALAQVRQRVASGHRATDG